MRKKRSQLKKKRALKASRLRALSEFETSLTKGANLSCGIDEAGRGPLAGPVVAGAVIVKKRRFKNRIDDSKRLTAKEREEVFKEIKKKCLIGIGIVDNKVIDKINIFQATQLAMKKALASLKIKPHFLLVDGNMKLNLPIKTKYITGGDGKCLSIACASIVAKVTRDAIMNAYHKRFPIYCFKDNKGYPTKAHRKALTQFGLSPIHRRSFKFKPILNPPDLATA